MGLKGARSNKIFPGLKPPYLTPTSLTTAILAVYTSLNFYFTNELICLLINVYNFIGLQLEILGCSTTFYVCSITSPQKI